MFKYLLLFSIPTFFILAYLEKEKFGFLVGPGIVFFLYLLDIYHQQVIKAIKESKKS